MKKMIKGAVFLAACLMAITTLQVREVKADEIDYASMRNDKKVVQSYMNCSICKSLEEHMNHMLYLQGAGNYDTVEAVANADLSLDELSSNTADNTLDVSGDMASDIEVFEEVSVSEIPVTPEEVSFQAYAENYTTANSITENAAAIAENIASVTEKLDKVAAAAELIAADANKITADAGVLTAEEAVAGLEEPESNEEDVISDVNSYYDYSARVPELDELYRLVQSEAGSESMKCKEMVTGVVLNRVASERFPNTVHSVIHAPGAFSVVDNNAINRVTPTEETIAAVNAVYFGTKSVPDNIVFFRNNHYFNWCKAEFSIDHTYFSSFRS